MNDITPCLWFDTEGEDAAKLYTPCSRTRRSSAFPVTAQPVPVPREP